MEKRPLKKILFVDDDQDILTVARYALEKLLKIEIRFLSSGEEAIQEALIFHPDLIILDVMMPKMDGFSTFKALRMLPSLSKTPIIFLTAKVQKEEIAQCLNMGALDVIKKPFDPLTLASTIESIWNKQS